MPTPAIKDKTLVQDTTLAQRVETEVSKSFPVGAKGMVPFIKDGNTRLSEMSRILKTGEFVENDAELNDSKSRITTMATVFNEWARFSHDASANQPANASEITSWTYDTGTDTISCLVNSNTHIGFVSKDKYDKYLHEVRLSSTSGDDDVIGVVIAFAIDANGKEHTLTALRSTGGFGLTWCVQYNYARTGAKIIQDKTAAIKWGNGNYGANAPAAAYTTNQALGGWDDFGATGTKVKIERNGDIIKAITTDLGSDIYVVGSEIIIDLTSDPVLAIFRGPASYGFSALSQPAASYKVLTFSETANVIYDLRTDTAYIHNGSDWVVDASKSLYDEVGIGRLLHNKTSGKVYFMESDGPKKIIDQAALSITSGTISQYFRGDKTWRDFAGDVRSAVLTGLSTVTNVAITAADTVLDAFGKLQKQITDLTTVVGGKISSADRGVANGIATLDATAKVPAIQLPSYVDDVIEVATKAALPATGESGKIYLVLADESRSGATEQYRWSGSVYSRIPTSPGSTDEVTEGVSRLYFTATRVLNSVLTGLNVSVNSTILASDTLLAALGKLQKQIDWNASSLTFKEPALATSTTDKYYRGDKSWQDFAPVVRIVTLQGLSTASVTAISAADTILSGMGKLQAQFTDVGISKPGVYGSLSISGFVGGYGGINFTGVPGGGSLRDTGSIHSYWRAATGDLWTCDNTGLFLAKNDVGSSSDETLKTNWRTLSPDFIKQLANIKHGIYDRIDIDATQVGVSAQSVLKEVPDLEHTVHTGPDGKLTVAYANAALVSAVELAADAVRKEELIALQAELIQKLTERVAALENKSA